MSLTHAAFPLYFVGMYVLLRVFVPGMESRKGKDRDRRQNLAISPFSCFESYSGGYSGGNGHIVFFAMEV